MKYKMETKTTWQRPQIQQKKGVTEREGCIVPQQQQTHRIAQRGWRKQECREKMWL